MSGGCGIDSQPWAGVRCDRDGCWVGPKCPTFAGAIVAWNAIEIAKGRVYGVENSGGTWRIVAGYKTEWDG